MSTRRISNDTLPVRLRVLFGQTGLTQRLMVAFGRGHSSVEDILSGRNVPPEIVWLVECLERLPVRHWHGRWIRARGADAAAHAPVTRAFAERIDWSDEELNPAHAVLNAGGTYEDAARALGITKSGIASLVKNARLPRSKKPRGPIPKHRDPQEAKEALRLYHRAYARKRRHKKFITQL